MSVFVGLDGTLRYTPPLTPTPLFFLLCFCADEIKDDFDTLGPDATLQAVGNGTGELTDNIECVFLFLCAALSPCAVYFTVCPCNLHCNML